MFCKISIFDSILSMRIWSFLIPSLILLFSILYLTVRKRRAAKVILLVLLLFSVFINFFVERLGNKYVIKINLANTAKEMVVFDSKYNILHPEYYNQQGKFSVQIKPPGVKYKRIYLKIRAYVIYKNNYVKFYIFDKQVLYLKGGNRGIRETEYFNITDLLKENEKVTAGGKLFTDKNTSVEPFDSRIEEISLCYE